MDDKQFDKFMKLFNQQLKIALKVQTEEVTQKVSELFETRFLSLESKVDWIIDALDTEETERLAGNVTIDRALDNHERRITKLELV